MVEVGGGGGIPWQTFDQGGWEWDSLCSCCFYVFFKVGNWQWWEVNHWHSFASKYCTFCWWYWIHVWSGFGMHPLPCRLQAAHIYSALPLSSISLVDGGGHDLPAKCPQDQASPDPSNGLMHCLKWPCSSDSVSGRSICQALHLHLFTFFNAICTSLMLMSSPSYIVLNVWSFALSGYSKGWESFAEDVLTFLPELTWPTLSQGWSGWLEMSFLRILLQSGHQLFWYCDIKMLQAMTRRGTLLALPATAQIVS